jgi:hypothetical protein
MFTHVSYAAGMRQLNENRRRRCEDLVTWDAGDGWRAEGFYCSWRNRIVVQTRLLSDPMIVLV